jgi:hypothetical protein
MAVTNPDDLRAKIYWIISFLIINLLNSSSLKSLSLPWMPVFSLTACQYVDSSASPVTYPV